jgi:hypothetical protein
MVVRELACKKRLDIVIDRQGLCLSFAPSGMKKHKLKAAKFLLVVFSAILLASFYYSSNTARFEETEEITVVHKHELSGEAPGNVSRTYVDQTGFEGRVFHEFTFHSIQEFHGQLSQISLAQIKTMVEQFKAPVKVYKQIRKFLI